MGRRQEIDWAIVRRPSVILLVMTFWWIIPFMVRDFATFPFIPYFTSHLLYLLVIAISTACALALGWLDGKKGLWSRHAFWGKYLILMAAYTAQMALILAVVLALDYVHLIDYYGGDAGGSVGLLFLPSAVVYFVVGGILGIIGTAIKWAGNIIQP